MTRLIFIIIHCHSYQAVESMRQGKSPKEAAVDAIERINKYYPGFSGAIIVANTQGEYGRSCYTNICQE